jgi:acetoin utilization deacetylase AcuC-like enzyme
MNKKKPGILFDNRLFRHVINQHSPENPKRLRSLYQCLDTPVYHDQFLRIAADRIDMEAVEAVHPRFYLDQIRTHSQSIDPFAYDKDTYVMADTLDSAVLAAGGCLDMAEAVMSGTLDKGFALIRPPGHHAEPGRGMGFCVLNNIAIIAAWLRRVYGLSRILIFDFDVHHGNGTQEAFYGTNEVLVCSFHQNDLFPFTGQASELGEGKGRGYNVNVPVYPQYGDIEYTYLTGQVLQNLVEQYMPQIILVSAGFDGHQDDPISKTHLTTQWFATVTAMLKQMADGTCDGRLLMVLEGGYNPESLQKSVIATLKALVDENCQRVGIMHSSRAASLLANHPVKQFWTF